MEILWWDMEQRGRSRLAVPEAEVRRFSGASIGRRTLLGVEVLVVEASNIADLGSRKRLPEALGLPSCPPVILITSPDPENLRFLKVLPVDEVCWPWDHLEWVIVRATELAGRTIRMRIRASLLDALPKETVIWRALGKVFDGKEPVLRVEDLARAAYVGKKTLWRSWVAARADWHPKNLKVILDLALILRAWEYYHFGAPVKSIPRLLGLHERTLQRISGRLLGLTLLDSLTLEPEILFLLLWGSRFGNPQEESRSA